MLSQGIATAKEKRPRKAEPHACRVKIGKRFWIFRTVPDQQFLKLTRDKGAIENGCLRDNATRTITISGALPINEQLGIAGGEAATIALEFVTRMMGAIKRKRKAVQS